MRENSFKDFILEQLQGLPNLRCRSMFGGFGLYLGSRFFGIISDGPLFFKTSEETRAQYARYGMKPFSPTPRQVLKNYYEVPPEIIENSDELCEWARISASLG